MLESGPADEQASAAPVAAPGGSGPLADLGAASTVPAVPPPSAGPASTAAVDEERLRQIRAETAYVNTLLANVFADEEEALPAPSSVDAGGQGAFPGLDAGHVKLAEAILASTTLARADFDRLAGACGLMPDGALETMNEWAYDSFGEPLIEDGEPMTVHSHLLDTGGRADAA